MQTTSLNLSPQKTQRILWTVLLLMPIIGMTVDLVAPSLPAIATGLSVSNAAAQGVISIYLLGYALGNFFTGPLTDALGRRTLLRISLTGFVCVSLIPAFLPHIGFLLLARLLQGFTIGAAAVLARAIFADILVPEKLIRVGNLVGAMWGLGTVIGPVIGGYLQTYLGWQGGFYFFALLSFLLLLVVWFVVPETHFNRHPLHIKTIQKNLKEILRHRLFMALVILMGLSYSLLIVFNTLGPFLIQTQLHYSPIYFGHMALYLGLIFLVSTLLCRSFLARYKVEQIFFIVLNLSLFVVVPLFAMSFFLKDSIVLIAVASGFMFCIAGFVFPTSMGKGLSLFRHIAGTASAAMYLINILITSLCALLVSFIHVESFIPLMACYLVLMLGCVLLYWKIIHNAEK